MIISDRFMFAVEYLKNELVINAPFDTGNMALNSIRIQQIDGKYHIVIGGEVAPYAIYTEEPWIERSGKNPNEGWIERIINTAKPHIIEIMSGSISQEEYEKDVASQERKIRGIMEKRAEIKEKQKEKIGEKTARRGQA